MKEERTEKKQFQEAPMKKKMIAKKDFKFKHNAKIYEIKEGQELDVPEMFLANLKTEKVI